MLSNDLHASSDARRLTIATGAELIATERERQLSLEGWTAEHDSEHTDGELRAAAHAYLENNPVYWPWERSLWKPSTHIRNLVKAGALIAAEIDRLIHLSATGGIELDGREGMPLRASVANNALTVSIGISTLAFAFENSEWNNPYNETTGGFDQVDKVSKPMVFAEDVAREMNREGEDGSTPLTRFIDQMCSEAIEQGSEGIADDELDAIEAEDKPEVSE